VNIIVVYKKAWRIIFELYGHINYFPVAQIYKLFLGISYVFLMSYVHCEQALIFLLIDKCKFGLKEVKYLGHKFSETGISLDEEKIEAVKNMPRPSCKKDLVTVRIGSIN
jgi:hypothetical protein